MPAIPGVSEASAGAAGADEPALTSLAPQSEPAPTDQAASTQQAASSAASAAQQQPQNIVISIRINSPGDDGPITQTNAAVGAAGSSNGSATGQSAGSGSGTGQGGAQSASTSQTADSNASASQNQPQNTVISIRINSPGDNGAIVQQNFTVSVSSSGNVSITGQQQGPAQASAEGPKTLLAASPSQRGAASIKGGGASSRASTPPPAPKASTAVSKPAATASSGTWHAAPSTPANPTVVPSESAGHASRPAAHRLVPRQVARTAHRLAAAVPRTAADLLKNVASRPAAQANDGGNDVSSAVVLTLVAVLAAFAVLFASTFMGRAGNVLGRATWRLR